MDEILIAQHGLTAVVTLNAPERRNALSKALRVAITNALRQIAADGCTRAVILTGADPAFCSGMDLADLSNLRKLSAAQHRADAQSFKTFFEMLRTYPLPLVAAVNGPAVAGGCGVALLADAVVTSPRASFSFSEVKIGFVPALVGVYAETLARTAITREMLLSGRTVEAVEAFEEGLVHRAAESHEQLLPTALEYSNRFAKCAPEAVRATKAMLSKAAKLDFESALKLAVEVNSKARKSPECQEGVASFLEKRRPSWVTDGS